MPTIRLYQAVLRDPGPTLGKRLRRAFSTWLTGQGFPEIPISPHVEYTHQDRRACLEARHGCVAHLEPSTASARVVTVATLGDIPDATWRLAAPSVP